MDRAGAASTDIVYAIVRRLKDRWRETYAADDINWQIWANDICREPTHRHDALINEPPPRSLIHLFRHSPVQNDAVVASVGRQNDLVIDILDDVEEQLDELDRDVSTRFQRLRRNLKRQRMHAIALRNSLHPEERPDSARILDTAENLDDVDHPEE